MEQIEFVYLTAYKVLGIAHKSTDPDIALFEATNPYTNVWVTANLDQHLRVLDRQVALATMMLRGLVGQEQSDEFPKRLEQEIQAVREQRGRTLGSAGLLVIEIRGEIDVTIKDPKREIEDFVLCFDAYDKKALRRQLQNRVAAILAAVRIGSNGKYEVESIASNSYLVDAGGRVVHSFSPEMGTPTLYISAPITNEHVSQLRENIDLVLKEYKLSSVIRLFAHSLDRNTDPLRTFISAWSALEILIGKIFPQFESALVEELSKISAAPSLKQYLERISDVMRGKYSLVDRFAVISIFLDGEKETDDIDTFKKIKKVRDDMFHGQDVPEANLPNRELQRLFEKYFRNHIRGNS